MKIQKHKPEEILGLMLGVVFNFIMFILSVKMRGILHFSNQIIIWIVIGLIPFFITLGHYIVSRKVIDEKTRNRDIIGLKGNIIGYFLWLIIIILATLQNIEIDLSVIIMGGYITILLIYVYMNRKGLS